MNGRGIEQFIVRERATGEQYLAMKIKDAPKRPIGQILTTGQEETEEVDPMMLLVQKGFNIVGEWEIVRKV